MGVSHAIDKDMSPHKVSCGISADFIEPTGHPVFMARTVTQPHTNVSDQLEISSAASWRKVA